MTSVELRAVVTLSIIMSLRMIGLFMVLPVFSLYAAQLNGATPTLIGLGIGVYGLFQALFQIPFGSLSDRIGRKPIIFIGLLIFAAGSILAGCAHSMIMMIIGRSLQGTGAIGSTILAMMADLTREESRTKSMAIAGMSIGLSFAIAMLAGPVLTQWMPINSLFFLAACFAVFAIGILYFFVPVPPKTSWHRDTEPELSAFFKLLITPELAKLNAGIFILHTIFTASFIVIPISLYHFTGLSEKSQWLLYLPTLTIAFIVSLICINLAETKKQLKKYFLGGIIFLMIAQGLLWLAPNQLAIAALGLCSFFGGFSLLEAFLPSLISRTAPAERKGTALGIYSCSQFLGIFIGGLFGGWLYGKLGFSGVYLFCISLSFIWLILALSMQSPQSLTTYILRLLPTHHHKWSAIAASLSRIPGIIEVAFIADEGLAYLKMERATMSHPDFIHLKEQLQSE